MTPLNWQDHDVTHPLELGEPHWIDVPDLFGDGYDDDQITELFAVMAATPQHTYMLATKHPQVMADYLSGKWLPHSDVFADGPTRRFAQIAIAAKELVGAGDISIPPLPNFLPGVLVRTQREADERIPVLLGVQAAARFVLCEPREGVTFERWMHRTEGWTTFDEVYRCRSCGMTGHGKYFSVPTGGDDYTCACESCGESAEDGGVDTLGNIHGVRVRGGDAPMHPDWVRSLRDQCAAAGVAFAFEGWGSWKPKSIAIAGEPEPLPTTSQNWGTLDRTGEWFEGATPWNGNQDDASETGEIVMVRVGHAASGRLLDGVQHDAYPQLESEVGR